MVEAMTKAVSSMTVQSCPSSSSKGTQYQGASSFIGRPRPPQLACGANGTLLPSLTCIYCKDTGHFKDNCVQLNNKIAQKLAQEQAMQKASVKTGSKTLVTKKIMAPQTLDQSDGEKVCGPDWIDKTIMKSKGMVKGLIERYPASRSLPKLK